MVQSLQCVIAVVDVNLQKVFHEVEQDVKDLSFVKLCLDFTFLDVLD